jgi:hypothetical protein
VSILYTTTYNLHSFRIVTYMHVVVPYTFASKYRWYTSIA